VKPVTEKTLSFRGLSSSWTGRFGAQTGLVTVLGFVEDKPHAIKMELGVEDYRQVILAHDRQVPIFALGELVKEGRSYVLRKPREIRLIHSD